MRTLVFRTTILTSLFLAGFGFTSAQSQPDPVQYLVAPELPGPNQLTSIQVEGVGGFLGNATITWSVAGQVVQSGVGQSFLSFTTGALGSQTRVRVSIQSPTQGSFSKEFIFSPSVVNMVWEAGTTVPPLYAGKALYTPGSSFKVVAFPSVYNNGTRISPGSLSYQWTLNDEPLPSLSGTGRSSLVVSGNQLQTDQVITVDVFFGSRKVARGEVVIPSAQPQVLLYFKDPLRGVVWDVALPQAIQLNTNEITVVAQPYFFDSSSARTSQLSYEWTLNGEAVSGPLAHQGQVTLRQTGNGAGAGTLGVAVQNNNADQFVQAASNALQLVFGTSQSLLQNLFGL